MVISQTDIKKRDAASMSDIFHLTFCLHGYLLRITSAPITPGTQPKQVRRKTMSTEPHPWSITAKGGKKIASNTRSSDIVYNS